jgi:FAD/FMN-containing dehydrogenase
MDEYYDLVLRLGGSTAGEHNDGRLRGSYLPKVFGGEMYQLFQDVKKIFDPHNMFNPGVKIDVDREEVVKQLRHEYSMDHLADHLPRT